MRKWLVGKTVIERCYDCDHKIWVISVHGYCCEKSRLKDIKNTSIIPKWCRLEDYKE